MALKDLVAQRSALAEDAIETIVADYVRYDPDEREIAPTPEFAGLSNRMKVLVYLVARLGWQFVVNDPVAAEAMPAELEDALGIPGGSLRPVLKNLKDNHLVVSRPTGYGVRAATLDAIRRELQGEGVGRASRAAKKTRSPRARQPEQADPAESNAPAQRRRSSSGEAAQKFAGWLAGDFFDAPRTLADVQARFHQEAIIIPSTSIPKYLLAAVRGQQLVRSKQDVNGRLLWVYSKRK